MRLATLSVLEPHFVASRVAALPTTLGVDRVAGALIPPQPGIALTHERRPAILAVDDDPAVLAAVARDERGFILAGPDVRARSIKRVASTVGEGSMAVSLIHQYPAGCSEAMRAAGIRSDSKRVSSVAPNPPAPITT